MRIVRVLGVILSVAVLDDTISSRCSCHAFSAFASTSAAAAASTSKLGSSSSSSSDGGGIKIVGLPGGQVQSLPRMYVKSFRRWIVEGEITEQQAIGITTDTTTTTLLKAELIRGSGSLDRNYFDDDSNNHLPDEEDGDRNNNDERGWVNPTSTNLLWWPSDLPTLQIRPMLNVLFRNGVLSYVSVGLDVRVPHRGAVTTTATAMDDNVSTWRNHGLNSQPIARQWTTLDIAMEKLFHVEGFVVFEGVDDDSKKNSDGDERTQQQRSASRRYDTLFPSLNAQGALQKVARFVAELDPSSPLALGFHIASVPMTKHWIDLPTTNTNDGDTVTGKSDDENDDDETEVVAYKIVCMATSEPFASKLLDLDEDVLTITSSSVLEVDVSRIAPGAESIYLTDPYKELYLGGNKMK